MSEINFYCSLSVRFYVIVKSDNSKIFEGMWPLCLSCKCFFLFMFYYCRYACTAKKGILHLLLSVSCVKHYVAVYYCTLMIDLNSRN